MRRGRRNRCHRKPISITVIVLATKFPYELVELSLANGQHLKDDFLSINPFGKLPAMRDDFILDKNGQPLILFESGSILLHLEEHHGGEVMGLS
ncbi:MAG: glutathione S-transferase N-terminal domain-containing protein [Synechococcus sp. BS30m-G30]|nr:glutathione S-transferase N-terminal domain-containing protein [Synechococcus sp. BS30m-G30]